MTSVADSNLFFEKLKAKLRALGFQDAVAITAASSIRPIKLEGNTLIAECKNAFYRDTVLNANMQSILGIARECWGEKVEFYLRTGQDTLNSPLSPKRRPRTSASAKNHPLARSASLFDFGTNDPDQIEPPSQPKTAPEKNEAELNQSVTIQAKKNIDKMSVASDVTPNPIDHETSQISMEAIGQEPTQIRTGSLIQEFTFSTFVRGQSNVVACTACEAVAKNPGFLTNPVFIYGATGLGKTHLLHSVGNQIRKQHKDWKIVYVSSGDFVNDFIAMIRFNKQEFFHQKYRNCDVLLVDDIQLLENKEGTQLEFFHTFNELYQRKKQIVITSDKYPKDIPNIHERLKSRFVEGLIAEVEPPSFEDRLAIIEAKSRMLGLKMKSEIAQAIASHVKSNVRELQGILNNLMMEQSCGGKIPSLEGTTALLKRFVRIPTNRVDMGTIQRVVATNYGIKLSELLSPSRSQRLVVPRHVAMYLAKEILEASTTEIAEAFGKKDHTTVMHALSRVKDLLESDTSTRATVFEIKRRLDQNIT